MKKAIVIVLATFTFIGLGSVGFKSKMKPSYHEKVVVVSASEHRTIETLALKSKTSSKDLSATEEASVEKESKNISQKISGFVYTLTKQVLNNLIQFFVSLF